MDLLGYKPTFEEVQAFLNDRSPNAYEKLIDRLLASPQYGERWGRHWMDVARYAEDNPTSEATNPPYPFAWRYRDWIIEALNADMPYDRFIKLQLAADLMPNTTRDDMRALGYVGAAPIYHHDLRLSGDVIGTFLTDDWDERIDAVSRGVLGVSVACARCHDHKFDPITQKDYYALMGVFASTVRVERPMFAVDPKIEQRYMWLQRAAVRPGVFDQSARERGHHLYERRREGGEVEGGDGKPQDRGNQPARQVSAARAEPRKVLESAASSGRTAAAAAAAPPAVGAPPAGQAAAAAKLTPAPVPPPVPARGRGPQVRLSRT